MELTQTLQRLQANEDEAMHLALPLVYEELKKLASSHLRREAKFGQVQTTALVHEAFLRLSGSHHPCYENRSHFYGIVSRLMRQVLVDMARARAAGKRDGGVQVPLVDFAEFGRGPDRSLVAIDDALQLLEKSDPLKAKLIEMRYFGGMTADECSRASSIPVHVVRRELRLAQAWLRKEVEAGQ